MLINALGRSGLFVSSVVIGGWNVTVMGYSGGYLGDCTCSMGVSCLMSRSMLGYGMSGSYFASSVACNL